MIRNALFAVYAALLLALPAPVTGHEVVAGDLTIIHPTARPNLPNRPTAAYMVIANDGAAPDRLISVTSPVFGRAEIHLSSRENGVMRMQMVSGIDVPAGDAAMLQPGGYHVMLFQATQLFKEGALFPITLHFARAGAVEVSVKVDKRIEVGAHEGHGEDHDHDHGAEHGHGEKHNHDGHGDHGPKKVSE